MKQTSLIIIVILFIVSLVSAQSIQPDEVKKTKGKLFRKIDNTVIKRKQSHLKNKDGEPIIIENLFPGHGLTDPHVWFENGRMYLFAGHDSSWKNDKDWIIDRWEIWSTDNLFNWRYESSILPEQTYMGKDGNCWAGDIMRKGDKYFWYFSNRNHNIGVMVSDKINKGYKDALGRPLIEMSMISESPKAPNHVYDPEVFEVDGKYYIIFGGGSYYIAQLADDMISLAEEPKLLHHGNGDKPAMFKRNGTFYLFWDNTYVTLDNIYGPCSMKKRFVKGGHGCAFEWEGQWYTILENDDISQFFRGMSLKPLNFNEDGTVIIPPGDYKYPGYRKDWSFEHTAIGWFPEQGTTLEWDKKAKTIKGDINGRAILQSNYWLMNEMRDMDTLHIRMKNQSLATQAKVYVIPFIKKRGWRNRHVDWENEYSLTFNLSGNCKDFVDYIIEIDKSKFPPKSQLKLVRIEPALGVTEGQWEIESIRLH